METHQGQLLGRTGGSVCENTLSSSDKPVLSAHGSSPTNRVMTSLLLGKGLFRIYELPHPMLSAVGLHSGDNSGATVPAIRDLTT